MLINFDIGLLLVNFGFRSKSDEVCFLLSDIDQENTTLNFGYNFGYSTSLVETWNTSSNLQI